VLLLSSRRLLGLGGIIGPAAFVTAWAVLGARKAGYNPVTDQISRLAAAGVPERPAMSAGFVVFGLAVPAYGLALRRSLPGPAWTTAVATGLATLGVAAFPLDGPAGDTPHAIAAGIGYATLAATPLLAARPLHRSGRPRWAVASVVSGQRSLSCGHGGRARHRVASAHGSWHRRPVAGGHRGGYCLGTLRSETR
jgi:hypothetical membrane protein